MEVGEFAFPIDPVENSLGFKVQGSRFRVQRVRKGWCGAKIIKRRKLGVTGDLNTTFRHRPIYICGEAATTTLNPEPDNLFYFLFAFFARLLPMNWMSWTTTMRTRMVATMTSAWKRW